MIIRPTVSTSNAVPLPPSAAPAPRSVLLALLAAVLLVVPATGPPASAQAAEPEAAAPEAAAQETPAETGEPGASGEEDTEAPALLVLEGLEIEPANPGPDTLVQLTAKLANRGERIASRLHFVVSIEGQELPVYTNQLFLAPLPPDEVTELRLYNFWTTETGRPVPADGKLDLVVTLDEAQWTSRETEEGVEVWKPLGAVPGLPSTARLTIPLAGVEPAGEGDG